MFQKHAKPEKKLQAKKPATLFLNGSIGARYKRIRKRPRGIPSPQLYLNKKVKLQKLESLNSKGKIGLYYADESHVCTPYGGSSKMRMSIFQLRKL